MTENLRLPPPSPGRCFPLLLGLAVLAWGGACRSSQPPSPTVPLPAGWLPGQAQVVAVEGPGLRVKNAGGSWHKPRLDEWLGSGASLEVQAPSCLTLRLYEVGVLVHVKPGALLQLRKLSYRRTDRGLATSTLLELTQGEVAVDNANLPPASEFEILTPQGKTRIPPPAAK